MSKSKLPKWVNPTGEEIWDGYYTVFWNVLGIGCLVILLAIAAAVYFGNA